MSNNKKKALFICLGNICRSPIAEGVFQKTVNDMGLGNQWEIDSAAIGGWHVGNPPDWRALDTMKKHGVPYNNTARQIVKEDFNHYDYIFGMDEENMRDLKKRAPKDCKAKLLLFGDFDPQGDRIIRDPYYKMPFKVVQTLENGELLVTYCPENWETGGKLFWPPSMIQGEKLKKKESSRPGHNWLSMDCEVKRVNLSLQQAQAAVEAMSDISETEEEECRKITKTKRRKLETKATASNYNKLAEGYIQSKKEDSVTVNVQKETSVIEASPEPDINCETAVNPVDPKPVITYDIEGNGDEVENNNIVIVSHEDVPNNALDVKLDMLISALVVVQENQNSMKETQGRILRMISNVDLKLEEFIKRAHLANSSENIGIESIDDKWSMNQLEERLKDPVQAAQLKQKFLMVCGKGKGKGLNNCYSLVDSMFTRRFLTKCSWSGGSRSENEKICFKAFEHIIDFFFSLIRESDPTFTVSECKQFFKNILRNSNRRNIAQGVRTSSPRVRVKGKGKGKKSTANNKNNTDGIINDTDKTINDTDKTINNTDIITNNPAETTNKTAQMINEMASSSKTINNTDIITNNPAETTNKTAQMINDMPSTSTSRM